MVFWALNFCFVVCFLFIFTCETLPHRGYYTPSSPLHVPEFAARICRGYLTQEFAVRICRKNLPWLFAARICRRNLPWVFAGCTCKQICFSTCEQILFIWKQTFFIREQNFFVRFSLLTVFLFAIAVTVMGHRKIVFLIVKYIFKLLAIQES